MALIHTLTILIRLAALFSYVNHRLLKLPMTIGLMAVALGFSLTLLALGKLSFGVEAEAQRFIGAIDFNEALMHGMLGFLLFAGALHVKLDELAGFIAAFFPSSVIKGLLAAIGVILILKQIPHIVGHDPDPEGEMAFFQPDFETTFSELIRMFGDFQLGASIIGLVSIALLVLWNSWKPLKESLFPAPLAVVLFGVGCSLWFEQLGDPWLIKPSHFVQVPVTSDMAELFQLLPRPDF